MDVKVKETTPLKNENNEIQDEEDQKATDSDSVKEDNLKWWPQIAACIGVSFGAVSAGTILAYCTRALPQLQNEENKLVRLTEDEGSWFASIFWIVCVFSGPFGGALSGTIGRKRISLLSSPIIVLGWVIIGLAPNKIMLFFGRTLNSLALSIISPSMGVYISETAHPKLRGSLSVMPSTFFAVGLLLSWGPSYFLTWRGLAFLSALPAILLGLSLIPLHESPYWLVEAGKIDEARRSLKFYRGQGYNIEDELKEMLDKSESKKRQMNESSHKGWRWTLKRLCSRSFTLPFSCIGVISMLSTWTGVNTILNYMIVMLEEAGSSIDPEEAPIIVGSIRFGTAILAAIVMYKASPKVLFVLCILVTGLSNASIGAFSLIKEYHPEDQALKESFGWIPLAGIIAVVVMRTIGVLPVIHLLRNESFPTDIRTLAIGILQSAQMLFGAASVKFFPDLLHFMGLHGVFFVYAGCSLIIAIWGWISIQDNRGKSLIKVEESYDKKRPQSETTHEDLFESNDPERGESSKLTTTANT